MIQAVIAECFQEVTQLFDRYSTKKGLAVTFSRYIVNIKVSLLTFLMAHHRLYANEDA